MIEVTAERAEPSHYQLDAREARPAQAVQPIGNTELAQPAHSLVRGEISHITLENQGLDLSRHRAQRPQTWHVPLIRLELRDPLLKLLRPAAALRRDRAPSTRKRQLRAFTVPRLADVLGTKFPACALALVERGSNLLETRPIVAALRVHHKRQGRQPKQYRHVSVLDHDVLDQLTRP